MNKQEIEKLANELKNNQMTEVQKSIKTSKLVAALMELPFVAEDSNVEVATAFKSSFSRYGKTIDGATNKVVPFLQLFAHDYNLKRPDITKAQMEEVWGVNQSLRRKRMVDAIRMIQQNHGIKRLDITINPLNLAKVKELLNSIGATEEEIAWVESIYNETTTIADSEYENENTEKKTVRPSDPVSVDSYENAERTVDAVIDGIEGVLSDVDKENERKYVTWYLTLKARNYVSQHNFGVEMEKYMDKQLLEFCEMHGGASDVEIITNFTGLKYDSVRKSLKKAEKLFTQGRYGRAA